jgi:hypothetical protein
MNMIRKETFYPASCRSSLALNQSSSRRIYRRSVTLSSHTALCTPFCQPSQFNTSVVHSFLIHRVRKVIFAIIRNHLDLEIERYDISASLPSLNLNRSRFSMSNGISRRGYDVIWIKIPHLQVPHHVHRMTFRVKNTRQDVELIERFSSSNCDSAKRRQKCIAL